MRKAGGAMQIIHGYTCEKGVARFTCCKCKKTLPVLNAGRINPDGILQIARSKRWVVSDRRPQDTLCPECHYSKRPKTVHEGKTDSVIKTALPAPHPSPPEFSEEILASLIERLPRFATKFSRTNVSQFDIAGIGRDLSKIERALDILASRGRLAKSLEFVKTQQRDVVYYTKTGASAMPTITLNTEQRVKIRNLLDKHFDDGSGRYLDGFSDQKIGDSIGVPRIHVEQMREAAYGPIKVDPEFARLENEILRLLSEINEVRMALGKLKNS